MASAKIVLDKLKLPNDQVIYPLYHSLSPDEYLELVSTLKVEVAQIFHPFQDRLEKLVQRKNVLIKVNGIDANPYCYTRPSLVEAVIEYLQDAGVKHIYLIENSTQGNFTRIVFASVGYDQVIKRTGALPVYLDECPTRTLNFSHHLIRQNSTSPSTHVTQTPHKSNDGYDLTEFEIADFLHDHLIDHRDETFYIDIPKLKTHSMAGVTLGIKNQWGFPSHRGRGKDHNYLLHRKLIDVLEYIQPDFTLIEGVEGTIYGHYPIQTFVEKMVKPYRVLIGGTNVVATDMVGAALFGLSVKDVPHIQIAIDRNLGGGISSLEDVEIIYPNGSVDFLDEKAPTDLLPDLPPNIKIISGKEMWCKEGCRNNPLTLLQVLYYDYGGAGNFTLIAGKGLPQKEIDQVIGRVLIIGKCAITEVGDTLISRLGKKKVYLSHDCNDLAETTAALLHLMKVNPVRFVPLNPLKGIWLYLQAKFHRSSSQVPSIFAHLFKTV